MRTGVVLLLFGLWTGTGWAEAPLPDPTRPPLLHAPAPARSAGMPAEPALSSTLLGGKHPVAIIDGRAYTQGETVNGFRIRRIGQGWVRLQDPGGGTRLLRVPALRYRPQLAGAKTTEGRPLTGKALRISEIKNDMKDAMARAHD
ncbi:MAG: hypothetical protein ACOY4L_12620 [Pseudomonadota bacterium]